MQTRLKLRVFIKILNRDKILALMFLPFFIYYIVFSYIPMTGLVIAFKDFRPGSGIYAGPWVGVKWFAEFFQSVYAYRMVRNTVLISLYSLVYGFPVPILFAVCVTEIKFLRVRRFVQTASYLPHFISVVVLVGMINNLFSMNNGIINNVILKLGGKPINFLMDPSWFRTLYIGSGIWQGFGFSSILYIAAITGIDPNLYEAAKIDGITRFKQAYHITIPMILPTIIILFIMQLGRIMSIGFEKIFLMGSTTTAEVSSVIPTFVYNRGIGNSEFSFATAVGFFNSVINFVFVYASNRICRALTNTSLW